MWGAQAQKLTHIRYKWVFVITATFLTMSDSILPENSKLFAWIGLGIRIGQIVGFPNRRS